MPFQLIRRKIVLKTLLIQKADVPSAMDNDVLAYRVLLEKRKENAPFWEKKVLTVEEAAEYTGIGRTKIRQIIMRGDCPFAVTNGVQVCVIRDKFIDYLDKQFSI